MGGGILITGGFHTPGITERLKQQGIAYAVIAPTVESDFDDAKYHAAAQNLLPSLDELIQSLAHQTFQAVLSTSSTADKVNARSRPPSPPPAAPARQQEDTLPVSKREAVQQLWVSLKAYALLQYPNGIELARAMLERLKTDPRWQVAAACVVIEAGRVVLRAMGHEVPVDHHGTALALGAAMGGSLREVPPEPEVVRKSPRAFAYEDAAQGFRGVDLEHFIHAQYRLAERSLTDEKLQRVLAHLGLQDQGDVEANYRQLYETLARQGYTTELVDLINGPTYEDPRLAVTIIGQNPNPRAQGVYEAVSNSLDALGFEIGQFGKGVKQILDWLEPTGADRLDVWTRARNSDGTPGSPYRLTILLDGRDQPYVQLAAVSVEDFQQAAGEAEPVRGARRSEVEVLTKEEELEIGFEAKEVTIFGHQSCLVHFGERGDQAVSES